MCSSFQGAPGPPGPPGPPGHSGGAPAYVPDYSGLFNRQKGPDPLLVRYTCSSIE